MTPRWYAHRSKSRDTRPGRWTSYTISSPLGPHFRRASSRLMNQCAFKRDRRYLLALLTGGGAAVSNFRGADVVEILEEVGRQVGFPVMIPVDQGTEFVRSIAGGRPAIVPGASPLE